VAVEALAGVRVASDLATATRSRNQECGERAPYGEISLSRTFSRRLIASNRSRLSVSRSSACHSASNAASVSWLSVGPVGW
jgi:hypothetical protein